MKKEVENEMEDDLRSEYNFAQMEGGVRGKYVERYRAGTNLVLLDPDVAQAFPNDAAVNDALRILIQGSAKEGVVERIEMLRLNDSLCLPPCLPVQVVILRMS